MTNTQITYSRLPIFTLCYCVSTKQREFHFKLFLHLTGIMFFFMIKCPFLPFLPHPTSNVRAALRHLVVQGHFLLAVSIVLSPQLEQAAGPCPYLAASFSHCPCSICLASVRLGEELNHAVATPDTRSSPLSCNRPWKCQYLVNLLSNKDELILLTDQDGDEEKAL